ncbi:hypothetical protein QE152_g19210 [Popillia japonica]|uniref:Reverse transcriptase domain-containing protein n=1 Tax=Popillia japonica TaxID=7064 RepID=A0AAW1KSU6_POPJA
MKDYEELGHMTISSHSPSETCYYVPHHGVLKEESLTTKLRVVFNGSMPTTSGYSLNQLQMVGPTIQPNLFNILIRFRQHPYAIAADIEKMYCQVLVEPSQRPLQRILWRSNPDDPIQVYNLNTVTYDTASASFLAIRSLMQLGIDCKASHPDLRYRVCFLFSNPFANAVRYRL